MTDAVNGFSISPCTTQEGKKKGRKKEKKKEKALSISMILRLA